MANFGDFRGSFDKMIALLKSIDRQTSKPCCTLNPSVGENISIVSGSKYLKVTKTNGTGSVLITFPDATVHTLTAVDSVFEIPYTGGTYPAITISTSTGGTWKYLTLTNA